MTRMTGPDCVVMCNLINTHTHTHTHTDVHVLIKELAIRRVEHRSEIYSDESQHLAEGTGVTRLRRRFSSVLQQALSFRTRRHLCTQGVALASTRQLRSQDPVSVHTHRTEVVTGSEGREGANGVGGRIGVGERIGVGGGNGDGNGVGGGNGDVHGHGDGDGAGGKRGWRRTKERRMGTGTEAETGQERGWRPVDEHRRGTGTGTGVETPGRTQDGNGGGSGDGNESSSGDGNGNEDGNENEDRIGEGGGEAKKCKKPHKTCRRHVGSGGNLDGKREKRRKERVGPAADNPDNLENTKEAGRGGHKVPRALSENCTSCECVSPLSRLIRGFRNKYH